MPRKYKQYLKTAAGRAAKNRSQYKYRHKLMDMYGLPQEKAIRKHKELLRGQ